MQNKKIKILAIDDNQDNLIVLKAFVSDLIPDIEVLTALDGQKGIEIARKEDPDVILLDIIMPAMDGFEVCRRLKQDEHLQYIPVLFLTALKTSREIRTKALEVGAEAFLSKPFDETELITQILTMTKIKAANTKLHQEKEQLEILISERTYDIGQELTTRRKIEKELLLSNQNLKKSFIEKLFIIEFQRKLLEINNRRELYNFVGEKIKELIADGYTITSMLDENTKAMSVVDYFGLGDNIKEIIKIIGLDPRETKFYLKDMTEDELLVFRSGKLAKLDNGVYKLLCRKVPKTVCNLVEKFLQITDIYTIGFLWNGQHLGGLTILAKNNISDLIETIEIIVNHAALAINRIKAEEDMRASDERYKSIFDQSPLGIAVTDSLTGHFYNVNPKFAEITGRTLEELHNSNWMEITHPDDIQMDEDEMFLLNEGLKKGFNINKRYIRPDSSVVWVNMTIAPIKVEGTHPYHVCMIEDITGKREKEQRIEYLSYHDTLTNIYNRTFLEKEVERLDNEHQLPISIITGDINGLKLTNDTLGHAEGDKLLIEMAKILNKCTRKGDILARTGGDEFSILLPRTSSDEAQTVLERIYIKCNEHKYKNENDTIFLSISLGCATKTTADELFTNISKTAEDNMYKRKLLEHRSFHNSLISSMRSTLFEKNHKTEEHAARLVALATKVGRALKLREDKLSELELLSTLHDIGKISIDDYILTKPGTLTDKEWNEMKRHPAIGYRIAMASPELKPIADYILCHHERWDGKGYPQGLIGENIPLLSRIVAIVDAYDAMTEDRPYRKAMPIEKALLEIEVNAGTQFDPVIAELFLGIIKDNEKGDIRI